MSGFYFVLASQDAVASPAAIVTLMIPILLMAVFIGELIAVKKEALLAVLIEAMLTITFLLLLVIARTSILTEIVGLAALGGAIPILMGATTLRLK
jgi:hypothetical protein